MRITFDTSPKDLETPLRSALEAWHHESSDHLLEALLLVRQSRASLQSTEGTTPPGEYRRATNEVLLAALDALETHDAVGAKLLRARFLNQNSVRQAASTFNLSESQVLRRQRQALSSLAEVLLDQEFARREALARAFETRLPPPTYTRLFGVTEARTALTGRLTTPDLPRIIALVGMGGLGKTALAHGLARSLVHVYGLDNILWVQAPADMGLSPAENYESLMFQLADSLEVPDGPPPARLKQVHHRLKQAPYLIILDNLETDADTSFLLEQLQGIATPTKFLITTRSYPPPQAGLYIHRMAELPLEEATAFLRYHSEESGLGSLAITEPADAQAICALTGGNPLALKLVTGLVAIFPLPQVLADLAQSRSGAIEDLYRHIYWKAWQALSPDAQTLLQAMPLTAASGAQPEQMLAMSELDEALFWPALHTLVTRSLVEVYGTTTERRYGIHALTRTFLHTEIIRWEGKEPG